MAIRSFRFLRQLLDVAVASPADGEVLTYDSVSGKWVNEAGGAGSGGAPTSADYLVGTAQAGLSAEIVVGTSPGGELGGTWGAPTVDATHSGSSHAGVQAAAEATAAAALAAHLSDSSDAHDASAISILDTAADFDATDVEGALAELQADAEADATGLSDHIGDASAAHAASAISASSTTLVGVATDVQGVLEELDNGIADHLADSADAHAGTAITNTPAGSVAATTVQAAIDELDTEKVAANAGITGATKTKVTYDAKGLVTAGVDATTADIADATDKRYVTDAQRTVIGNTSGTNTGDQTSVSGNAGTATALATARNIDGQAFDGSADITVIAPGTHAATGKTTPVDADELALVDSAASNVLKKVTWANVKATLKTYFDTLYAAVSHTHAAADIASGTIAQARLGTGSGGAGTKVLYDDQTYKTPSAGGSVATDAIWDAAGDIAVGTGADTASKLTLGASGKVPTSNGSTLAYAYPPGYEIGYVERTTNVTISATSEATPTDCGLSLGAITYDGTKVLLEFFCADMTLPTGAIILLFDGSTMLCRWGDMRPSSGSSSESPAHLVMRFTPSAGSHTYNIQAIRAGGSNATLSAGTGSGGSGTYAPAFLRATKV